MPTVVGAVSHDIDFATSANPKPLDFAEGEDLRLLVHFATQICLSLGMDSDYPAQAALPSSDAPPKVTITFESLTFSDGTKISLDPNDIVVLVGPNNAGKSLALRELQNHIGPPVEQTVIKSVSLRKTGSVDQLRELLERHGRKTGIGQALKYTGFRYDIGDQHLEVRWQNRVDIFRPIFCMSIATESRITDSNPQEAFAVLDHAPSHPIHILYLDDRVEDRISSYFRRAFGEELILFRAGGRQLPLLVGQRPALASGEDRVTSSYLKRLLASTVPLQSQGDGMRSFASVVLHMLAPDTQTVLLLDEPEAFLHPPQARLLGEFIAKERAPYTQLFIATHSAEVLQGLLNAVPKHLRVLRIQREGNVNRVKELNRDQANEISADPLMRYSSVMDGVFHQRVVICESDADCMFYNAILDLPIVHGDQFPDVLFVQSGGKHRMAALAEALRALDVTVDVIADIDILNDETVLRRVVLALGGDWDRVAAHAGPLKIAIEQHKPWLNSSEVANEIRKLLDKAPKYGEFPKGLHEKIKAVFRKASPWDAVKAAGEAAIPPGQATEHFHALQEHGNSCGLWIVPVGELEGFCKTVGGHGPRWVQKVIEDYDLANDERLNRARSFVREIWARRDLANATEVGATG